MTRPDVLLSVLPLALYRNRAWSRGRVIVAALSLVFAVPTFARAQSETVEYYGTDALGSVRIVFDANGNVLGRMDYGPFGDQLLPSTAKQPGIYANLFTEGENGLADAEARALQLRTGRFNSTDPLYNGVVDPQRWNRYAYALNNPVTFADPGGLNADPCDPNTCSSVTAAMPADIEELPYAMRLWLLFGSGGGGGAGGAGAGSGASDGGGDSGGSGVLDSVQTGLDAVSVALDATGAGATVSWIPDAANAGISVARGDTKGAALSAAAMVPFLGAGANLARIARDTKAAKVYLGYTKAGEAVYVGITNNLERRAAEHGDRFIIDAISDWMPRDAARAIEQAIIERSPGFLNVINSISPNNPIYSNAVAFGEAWLKKHGF
jgi:RHS repeat-associated protein